MYAMEKELPQVNVSFKIILKNSFKLFIGGCNEEPPTL